MTWMRGKDFAKLYSTAKSLMSCIIVYAAILVHLALGRSKQLSSCYTQSKLYGLGVKRCLLLAYCRVYLDGHPGHACAVLIFALG